MKIIFLTILLGWLSCSIGAALEPLKVKTGSQRNHLVPVNPRPDDYRAFVHKKLHVTNPNYVSFTYLPSLEAEMVVSVYRLDHEETESFHITTTRASSSLHSSMPGNNPERVQKEVPISRFDAEIDAEFAAAIQRAWASMLLRTRYPATASSINDGYKARFTAVVRPMGELWGETHSPYPGPNEELVNFGLALADYCTSDPATRSTQRVKLLKQLESFSRRARKL